MAEQSARFSFPKAEPYAFLFENAHLLLLRWERDNATHLFYIREQQADTFVLDYPGETFTNRVLDAVESIFFVQVSDEEGAARHYALGSYFEADGRTYGAYYDREKDPPDVVLFRIEGEPPHCRLEVPEEEEYARVQAVFAEQMQDWLDIQGVQEAGSKNP